MTTSDRTRALRARDLAAPWLASAALVGCGGEVAHTTPGSEGAPTCPEQGICGGDLEGDWDVETYCELPVRAPPGTPQECVDEELELSATLSIEPRDLRVSFYDGTFQMRGSFSAHFSPAFDRECFEARFATPLTAQTCASVGVRFDLEPELSGFCVFTGVACGCDIVGELSHDVFSTYRISDGNLILGAGGLPGPYCVSGATAVVDLREDWGAIRLGLERRSDSGQPPPPDGGRSTGGVTGSGGFAASGGVAGAGGAGAFGGFGAAGSSSAGGGGAPPVDPRQPTCTGPCGPLGCVEPIVEGLDSPRMMTLDATHVYWTENNDAPDGAVKKAPLVGGPAATLASGEDRPYDVAVDATHVYFTTAPLYTPNTVRRVPIDGGTATILFTATDLESPWGIALDDQYVYWADNWTGTVKRVPKVGGSAETLVSGLDKVWALIVDAETVYFTHNTIPGDVMSVAVTGGTPTVLASGQPFPQEIAKDDTNIYWLNYGNAFTLEDGHVMKMPLGGGTPTTLAVVPGESHLSGIAVDDTYVYFATEQSLGDVMRVPIAGGDVTFVARCQDYPSSIGIHPSGIYWTNDSSSSGAVLRLVPE